MLAKNRIFDLRRGTPPPAQPAPPPHGTSQYSQPGFADGRLLMPCRKCGAPALQWAYDPFTHTHSAGCSKHCAVSFSAISDQAAAMHWNKKQGIKK